MKRTLSRLRRGAAGVALSALAVTGLSVAPAHAADQDQVAAEGRFLDLDDLLLGLDLNPLANLNGHYNGIPSSEGSGSAPVDLDILGALNLQVGLTALPLQDLITLGVAEQYSKASGDGSLLASSGLIANDGAIATGTGAPGENAVIDLSKLLGTGDTGSADPTGLVEQLRLELGAVSGLAKYNKADGLDSDYQVAGAKLTLKSKVVGQLGRVSQ